MLWSAIVKDTQLLLRDRGALASLFLLPLIFVVTFGSMFSGSGGERDRGRALPVHYVDGDARAAGVVAHIEASGLFAPHREASAEAVRALVADEERDVGLVFPAGFDPAAGVPGELVIDGAAPMQVRGPLEGSLHSLVRAATDPSARATHPVLVATTPPGIDAPMDDIDGFQVSVPGNAVLFGFFLALTVALSFCEERRTGTWRRLLAAPVSRPLLLVAKLVPWFIIGVTQMTFLFGVGALAFGMRVGGSVPALVLLTLAVVACAVALGLFIASFGGTEKQVGSIGSISLLVMGLLGGAMIPRMVMPETMQAIGLATPHGWALDGYHALLIREGATLVEIAPSILAVCGFAAVFAVIGAARFKWN